MYFLFSGEGPTDLGMCGNGRDSCEAGDYVYGPMTAITDKIVRDHYIFSLIDSGGYGFVSRQVLVRKAKMLKQRKKSPCLPGKRKQKETVYFYRNARALALCAKEKTDEKKDTVVAVLFRDSDDRGIWLDKWFSMLNGFQAEQYDFGVPMLPKPKSEAWLLCALKTNPYQRCASLEDRSGSDKSPNPLKKELAQLFQGELPSRETLCSMVNDETIDATRIDMPSYNKFKKRLLEVLDKCKSQ